MGKWIKMVAVILLVCAATYWFLRHEGIRRCQAIGGEWSYTRWTCDS